MAIATAVPPTIHEQSTYPDYYFEATNCNHKTELKAKFKRICEYCQPYFLYIPPTEQNNIRSRQILRQGLNLIIYIHMSFDPIYSLWQWSVDFFLPDYFELDLTWDCIIWYL
jgi:hypothetical protein